MIEPGQSPRAILERLEHAEREAHDLLAEAARSATDSSRRALYERLARTDERVLRDLQRELDILDAREFVQKALDV
jgi:hypothetical protein